AGCRLVTAAELAGEVAAVRDAELKHARTMLTEADVLRSVTEDVEAGASIEQQHGVVEREPTERFEALRDGCVRQLHARTVDRPGPRRSRIPQFGCSDHRRVVSPIFVGTAPRHMPDTSPRSTEPQSS